MTAQTQIREIGKSINVDFTMKIDQKNYRFLDLWTWESKDAEKLEIALKTAGFKVSRGDRTLAVRYYA